MTNFDQRHQRIEGDQYNAVGNIIIHRHSVAEAKVSAEQMQNRIKMLNRVRSIWISGFLQESLFNQVLITLGLHEQSDALADPWRLVMQEIGRSARPLPAGTRILQVYDDADGELLILGEPGAGKTTLLLELARDLLDRAEQDTTRQMPVVFNLSSWAEKQQPLASWLVEELSVKYQVPHKVGQAWIDTDAVLLLLDGLDEVAEAQRLACIEAINTYRQEHYLVPVVACSRKVEYLAQPTQLLLHGAVVVQPLSTQQIYEYLSRFGEPLETVQAAMREDAGLREMVKTPLMLSIIILAYQGKTLDDLTAMGSPEVQRRQIFETYVQRMLHRRGLQTSYTSQQTMRWLAWLARQLVQQSQTVFYLERMQADSLSGNQAYQLYEYLAISLPNILIGGIATLLITTLLFSTVSSISFALCYSAMGGLIGGLIGREKQMKPIVENHVSRQRNLWSHFIGIKHLRCGLAIGLIYGLAYGYTYELRIGLFYGLMFGLVSYLLSIILDQSKLMRLPKEGTTQPRKSQWYKPIIFLHLKIGLVTGVSYGLGYGLSTELLHQLHISQSSVLANFLAYVLAYGLIGVLISILLLRRKRIVQPAEMIVWSWKSFRQNLINIKHIRNGLLVGLFVGLIMGSSFGLREEKLTIGLLFGLNAGLIFGVSYWLLLGLFRALSSTTLRDDDQRIKPNQGTWDSARNSVIIGIIGGSVSWFVCSLSYVFSYGLFIDNLRAVPSIGQQVATGIGLLVGLSIGLLCGLLNGGLAYLHHWILRLLLWRAGSLPWNYAQFLDYAAERILLRKVGGGYLFIHRLLLNHFAKLDTSVPPEM